MDRRHRKEHAESGYRRKAGYRRNAGYRRKAGQRS
jgi:hypothetical protein